MMCNKQPETCQYILLVVSKYNFIKILNIKQRLHINGIFLTDIASEQMQWIDSQQPIPCARCYRNGIVTQLCVVFY